jgi:hypothetical protein
LRAPGPDALGSLASKSLRLPHHHVTVLLHRTPLYRHGDTAIARSVHAPKSNHDKAVSMLSAACDASFPNEDTCHESYDHRLPAKTRKEIFSLIKQAEVRTVLDVRLNKTSQLAGFAKKLDLEFFLSELLDVKYLDLRELASNSRVLATYPLSVICV